MYCSKKKFETAWLELLAISADDIIHTSAPQVTIPGETVPGPEESGEVLPWDPVE